jgi:hypothetical protein
MEETDLVFPPVAVAVAGTEVMAGQVEQVNLEVFLLLQQIREVLDMAVGVAVIMAVGVAMAAAAVRSIALVRAPVAQVVLLHRHLRLDSQQPHLPQRQMALMGPLQQMVAMDQCCSL